MAALSFCRGATLTVLAVAILAFPALAGSAQAQSVVARQPGLTDGTPAYQQDMHWLDPDGQSWAMRDQGRGRAIWVYEDPAAAVIDEIGGVRPLAAYGTRRLTGAYAGPGLTLVRPTDGANFDIGFLADGSLDEASLRSFCARTECRITRWYDQSGNKNDAVQPTPSAQPIVRPAHRTGNSLSVVWDYEATSGAPARSLVLPDTLTVNSGKMGILWTGRFHNASLISPLLELGSEGKTFNFGFWDAHGDFYLGTPAQLGEVAGHATLTSSIGLISSSPSEGVVTNFRNKLLGAGTLKSNIHVGGYIGQTTAFKQNGMMELSSLIIYGRPLSPGDRFFGLQALGENFRIPQQQQDSYVADGDSITQGIASLYLQNYVWHMEKLLPSSLLLYDAGWAGKTLAGPGGLIDRYGNFAAKLYNPNAKNNLLSLLAGTNDIQNGTGADDVYRLITQYVAKARQTGFKVVVVTILPRTTFNPAMEAQRKAVNTMIRSNWQRFADGLADLTADPTLGAANVLHNPDVFVNDGTHLTDYGNQILAYDLAEAISKLLH